MVDDKQRPGDSEGDTPDRAPETGNEVGGSPALVNELAGTEGAPVAVAPGEPVAAEAGPGIESEGEAGAEAAGHSEPAEGDSVTPPLPPPPPPPPVRRRTPWGAMLFSGLLGGLIVAAAAAYAYLYYLPNNDSALSVLFARLGAAELTLRDLSSRPGALDAPAPAPEQAAAAQKAMSQLTDRLAKVEASLSAARSAAAAASDSSGPVTSDSATTAEQQAAAKALSEEVARLSQRMEETATALQQARESAAAATRAAEARSAEAPPAVGKSEFDALSERVAGLQRSMATLQQAVQRQSAEVSREDRGVRLAVVATGLRSAVERGAPFAGELEAAKTLMADPQAVALLAPFAATGVPTAAVLGQELAALAPSLATSGPAAAEGDQSYWKRLQTEAEKLVRVRPINEAPGNDPSAVAARLEALAKRGDIAGALTELQKLPEQARAPAEPWIKKAQAREAALAAARRIEAASVAALATHP